MIPNGTCHGPPITAKSPATGHSMCCSPSVPTGSGRGRRGLAALQSGWENQGFPRKMYTACGKTTGFPHLFVCYHQGNYSGLFWIGTSFFWMGYHKSVFFRWFSLHLQYLLWWWSTALSVICRPVFSQGHPTKHSNQSMNWGMTRFFRDRATMDSHEITTVFWVWVKTWDHLNPPMGAIFCLPDAGGFQVLGPILMESSGTKIIQL